MKLFNNSAHSDSDIKGVHNPRGTPTAHVLIIHMYSPQLSTETYSLHNSSLHPLPQYTWTQWRWYRYHSSIVVWRPHLWWAYLYTIYCTILMYMCSLDFLILLYICSTCTAYYIMYIMFCMHLLCTHLLIYLFIFSLWAVLKTLRYMILNLLLYYSVLDHTVVKHKLICTYKVTQHLKCLMNYM